MIIEQHKERKYNQNKMNITHNVDEMNQCSIGKQTRIEQLNVLLTQRLRVLRKCINADESDANRFTIDRTTVGVFVCL